MLSYASRRSPVEIICSCSRPYLFTAGRVSAAVLYFRLVFDFTQHAVLTSIVLKQSSICDIIILILHYFDKSMKISFPARVCRSLSVCRGCDTRQPPTAAHTNSYSPCLCTSRATANSHKLYCTSRHARLARPLTSSAAPSSLIRSGSGAQIR